ncbi:MAG TPA: hypothetical protein EYP24_02175 [bacterium (Candidatus Stahlbacteria)]|nr:hypothetical protein [Candidatus Stahlbacteria bacterium]
MYHIALSVEENEFRSVLNLLKIYGGRSIQARPGILSAVFEDGGVIWQLRKEFPESQIGVSRYQGIAVGLSAIAKSGEILVDQDTISPLMESFEFTSLGLMNIEGMRAQLMVYRVENLLKPVEIEKRTLHLPYLDREREEQILTEAIDKHNVVQLIGRDGIGKTSLLKHLAQKSERDVHFIPIWDYPPSIPFEPFETLIRSILRLKPDTPIGDAQEIMSDQLKRLQVKDFVSSYYTFLEFLGIGEEETIVAKLNLPRRYEMLKGAIAELIVKANAQGRIIIIFDDLQYADRSSLNLLKQIINDIITVDVKIIYSSEYPIDLGLRAESVELGLLNPAIQQELFNTFGVEGIEPGPSLPLKLKLYLSLVDVERDRAIYREYQGRSGLYSIPFKEIDWLINRWFDYLTDPAKIILQNGSVIGNRFTDDVIRYLQPKLNIKEALLDLANSELISINNYYQFQHRFIREHIYNHIPDREKIHKELSEYYHQQGDPIRTVFHLLRADRGEDAVQFYIDAAEFALRRSAWPTALDYYSEAKDLIRQLIEAKKDVDLDIIISIDERIGDVYRELGDEETALKYYKSVLDSYRDILKE